MTSYETRRGAGLCSTPDAASAGGGRRGVPGDEPARAVSPGAAEPPAGSPPLAPAGGGIVGWTLCSGIGAPEVGAPGIDWRLASEIEAFPRSVLSARLGYEDRDGAERRLWGDFTTLDPADPPARLPGVIVAGTPCQAFSVAGARKGLADPRGNLTLAFVGLCHDIAARNDGGLVAVWENVPGVLSDADNAFGCFLGGLVGADDPLRTPDGASWPGVGMVAGPRARVAWRVFDAQYFGVAQRRRRVFVVADIGNGADPAAILFERQGVRGNPAPRREAREDASADAGAGVEGCGWPADVAPTLNAAFGDKQGLEDQHALNGAGLFVPGGMGRQDFETETLVAFAIQERAVSENVNAGPQGAGWQPDKAYTLEARHHVQSVAFSLRGREGGAMPEVEDGGAAPALRAASGGSTRPMVAAIYPTLSSNEGGTLTQIPPILDGHAVRRLTPRECERLQGFPDDWTAVQHRGKPAADGPRYKALGNSWAVPCGAWVLRRVKEEMER